MKHTLLSFVLISTALVLAGCNGTVSSVSFPAAAPWEQINTEILSPTDDLVAVSAGAGLESVLFPGRNPFDAQAFVACQGSGGPYTVTCSDRACDAQATCGTDTVIGKRYAYTLAAYLDRDVFTSGSVQIQDGTGATQMGLAINAGNASGSFDVAAGFSEGLIPGAQFSDEDDNGNILLLPSWSDFGSGEITGQVCNNGVCETATIATCFKLPFDGGDILKYLTAAQPGTYSGICGDIPVNLTINPAYSSVGACISARKETCNGLTGQDKKTCNHAQIGVCQATFNVPSALAR